MGPVTTETTTPTSESTTRAATTDSYRTGFANPMFEEKVNVSFVPIVDLMAFSAFSSGESDKDSAQ